ncbi:MAG: hypothetical protein QF824_06095 [Candidatus Woesearchaeota archaeon]|jgi:predicted Ser/Thr protein kinase|nr:hypothetical protein [Candidatus Woesearchaeota archaeon]MDP7458144.1 hypothetical protein [Candidatus Woesearchaeota archaeon]
MKITGVKNIEYFSKGKRGIIYTGSYKNQKVAIKTKNPDSKAVERIKNEAKYMKLLNKHKIGPKLIKATDKYVMYKFVEGEFILDKFTTLTKSQRIKILKATVKQCYILDSLGISKEEMHHPLKHIVVTKKLIPVFLDFERCHYTEKPQNVTQCIDFLRRIKILPKKQSIKIAKQYRKDNKLGPLLKNLK